MQQQHGVSLCKEMASDYACLGTGLPPDAERELRLAGRSYHDDRVAEAHLMQAIALAPWHIGVYIGLYRFYFYKCRLQDALGVATRCLNEAAQRLDLPHDWRSVRSHHAVFNSYDAVLPRFYLFTLKAYAYLQMRLGNLELGRAVTEKLLELDPQDKLGSKVLLTVLERVGVDEYED